MGILRLAHVDVRTPDLDLSTAYYTEVIGLRRSARTDDAVYLKCWDEEDHHSLRMRYDPRTGMDLFTFRVEAEDDLRRLREQGRGRTAARRPGQPRRGAGPGRVDPLRDPVAARSWSWSGTSRRPATCSASTTRADPAARPARHRPPRMDHMLVNAEEVAESTRFFTEVLGLRMTEQVLDGNGHQLGIWLGAVDTRPHDLAIVNGPNGALHHFAYWLDDWDHVRKAADIAGLQRRPDRPGPHAARRHARQHHLLLRPARHPQRGVHRRLLRPIPTSRSSPGPRTTSARAIFYYENVISQRFLRMHT